MSAVLTVAGITPFHPSSTPTILVWALNLDILTGTWHCPSLVLTSAPRHRAASFRGETPERTFQATLTEDGQLMMSKVTSRIDRVSIMPASLRASLGPDDDRAEQRTAEKHSDAFGRGSERLPSGR
jgi:hypothetical protein